LNQETLFPVNARKGEGAPTNAQESWRRRKIIHLRKGKGMEEVGTKIWQTRGTFYFEVFKVCARGTGRGKKGGKRGPSVPKQRGILKPHEPFVNNAKEEKKRQRRRAGPGKGGRGPIAVGK